uniref:Uncharacterized protein n=1 Tax=Arundo donax TaxID=35708 RepID=A0A0A8YV93_ARUDO
MGPRANGDDKLMYFWGENGVCHFSCPQSSRSLIHSKYIFPSLLSSFNQFSIHMNSSSSPTCRHISLNNLVIILLQL